MTLAINIGNTHITIGVTRYNKIKTERFLSGSVLSKQDFINILNKSIFKFNINISDIKGVIISSVIPKLTPCVQEAGLELFAFTPVTVCADMNTSVDLSAYDISLIGSDRIAVCEAAVTKYAAPLIIIDFGTAITINVINAENKFLGGAIMPGLTMCLNALTKDTAQLPLINLPEQNPKLLGKNTRECIMSGVVHGNASMIDGMVIRIKEFLNGQVTVLVTGGNAQTIIPYCKTTLLHEPELLMEGLFILFDKNNEKKA